jgi:hypothetical protein
MKTIIIEDGQHREIAAWEVLRQQELEQALLFRRIKRKLIKEGELLRKARSFTTGLGDYYTIDLHSAVVMRTHINLKDLAKELGL